MVKAISIIGQGHPCLNVVTWVAFLTHFLQEHRQNRNQERTDTKIPLGVPAERIAGSAQS